MEAVRVFRQSGAPVRIADYEAFQADFAEQADKITERCGLNMEKAQRMFRFIERQLTKKWNKEVHLHLPVNTERIRELLAEYGTPITFAQVKDSDEVVVMLMDEL